MNVERLHVIALALRRELDERNVVGSLQSLVTACQQISQNPANAGIQQTFVGARAGFYAALADAPSDSFPPTWRQVLVELGGEDLFGERLRARVEHILNENQATLAVAYQQLSGILSELQGFQQSLARLTDAFAQFHIGTEEVAPGEAEVAVLIPRRAIQDKLGEFIEELDETKFILNTFSELATGQVDDLWIRSLSSSELMVYVAMVPYIGAAIAKAVDFVIEEYKKILEIRKLHQELERLQAPDDISERTKEWANTQMEAAIAKFTKDLLVQYDAVTDHGRRNELSNQLTLALQKIAARIDRGFSFEVRVSAPTSPEEANNEKVKTAVAAIQAVASNLQYVKLDGPPILSLPESTQPATEAPTERPKRRARKTRIDEDKK